MVFFFLIPGSFFSLWELSVKRVCCCGILFFSTISQLVIQHHNKGTLELSQKKHFWKGTTKRPPGPINEEILAPQAAVAEAKQRFWEATKSVYQWFLRFPFGLIFLLPLFLRFFGDKLPGNFWPGNISGSQVGTLKAFPPVVCCMFETLQKVPQAVAPGAKMLTFIRLYHFHIPKCLSYKTNMKHVWFQYEMPPRIAELEQEIQSISRYFHVAPWSQSLQKGSLFLGFRKLKRTFNRSNPRGGLISLGLSIEGTAPQQVVMDINSDVPEQLPERGLPNWAWLFISFAVPCLWGLCFVFFLLFKWVKKAGAKAKVFLLSCGGGLVWEMMAS